MLFIFDENCSLNLCQGIKVLEQGNHRSPLQVEIIHATEFMGKRGASDTELVLAASKKRAVIFTHDGDFRRIKHLRKILEEHEVGYVYFKAPQGYHYWDMVSAFIAKWEEIKLRIRNDAVPYAYEVSKGGQLKRNEF